MTKAPLAKKSLGQHWLNDRSTLEAICDAADLQKTDVVLEIGPGYGTLTHHLTKRVKKVVAVELDKTLAKRLVSLQFAKNLEVIEGDILKFNLNNLPKNYKIVANIPYYLTSNLIRVLSETPNQAQLAVLLVQKEVANRLAAKPGQMSLLSVSAQFYWDVSLGLEVPAKLFTPPPKVDSRVVILKRHKEPLYPEVNTKKFFQVVKAGFSAKRKTLLNSLSAGLRQDKKTVAEMLEKCDIPETARAQTLGLDQWHRLHNQLLTQ